MNTIDTRTRSRWHEAAFPFPDPGMTYEEIGKLLGITTAGASDHGRNALRKMRRAWVLWESIGWDTRRRREIRRELAELEGGR